MNLGKAFACAALAFVLTDFVKRAVPAKIPAFVLQLLAFIIGVVVLFMVAETTWAHSQIIADRPLDTLEFWDKVVAGLVIGGGATILDRFTLLASRNQGEKPE